MGTIPTYLKALMEGLAVIYKVHRIVPGRKAVRIQYMVAMIPTIFKKVKPYF